MTSPVHAHTVTAPLWRMTLLMATLLVTIGIIGSLTSVTGTITAKGVITTAKTAHTISHKTGGIIASVDVTEGKQVVKGDILFTLDTSDLRRTLARAERQVATLRIREIRLTSIADHAPSMIIPDDIAQLLSRHQLEQLVATEQSLFEADRSAHASERSRLRRDYLRARALTRALDDQMRSKETEIDLLTKDIEETRRLGASPDDDQLKIRDIRAQDKLRAHRLLELERERARFIGDLQRLKTLRTEADSERAELERRIERLDPDARRGALGELADIRAKLRALDDEIQSLKSDIEGGSVRAPIAGTVRNLAMGEEGTRIEKGADLLKIVTGDDQLFVDADIKARDLGAIAIGQRAHVRAASQPRAIAATVREIIPETPPGAQSRHPIFVAHLALESGSDPVPAFVSPGVPVDVVIETEELSALAYILRPLADALSHPAPR